MTPDALHILCKPCLDAFGLKLDSESTGNATLKILKNDGTAIVVQARCNKDGTTKDFVLKGTPFSLYRHSSAIIAIENLLGANDNDIVIPARWLTTSAKDTYITTESSANEQTVWSVTAFELNEPSFDWLRTPALWTSSHTYSAGALLAKAHTASNKIKKRLSEGSIEIETAIPSRAPELLLHAFENAGSNYLTRLGLQNRDYLSVVAILCKAALNIEEGVHAKALVGEEVVVHGDFQPGNVLYRDGKACGLIDWDYAHLDNPLMDLAYGLIMYACNLASENAITFDTSLSYNFLQGYADQIAEGGHKPICMPDCYFTPASRENRVFSDYMKMSTALIMLWSLSEYGQGHSCGVTVGRRTLELIQAL